MGLREQSIVGCFPKFFFSVFPCAGACGVGPQFISNFFPPRACAAGFNNNNNKKSNPYILF